MTDLISFGANLPQFGAKTDINEGRDDAGQSASNASRFSCPVGLSMWSNCLGRVWVSLSLCRPVSLLSQALSLLGSVATKAGPE